MLVFGTLQRVPITHDRRCYQIDTDGIQYMLATTNSKPLNLTLHENVRISVGRMKALVIDDSGKRVKLEVLAKKLK